MIEKITTIEFLAFSLASLIIIWAIIARIAIYQSYFV
jgi:hypothetical protein